MLWKQDNIDYKEQEEHVTEESCLCVHLGYNYRKGLLKTSTMKLGKFTFEGDCLLKVGMAYQIKYSTFGTILSKVTLTNVDLLSSKHQHEAGIQYHCQLHPKVQEFLCIAH
jgi:hypothetical protein